MTPELDTSDLLLREYWDVRYISGPLIFLAQGARFPTGAMLQLTAANGEQRMGQVLEASTSHAIVQVLQGTHGLDVQGTSVALEQAVARIGVSEAMIGRYFDGTGQIGRAHV